MKVLDLFSGIGGFSLGLERAGMETMAFCEFDAQARRVLGKNWPRVFCFHDVKTLSRELLYVFGYDRPDVICGGFPCQDISTAGSGAGLAGERSGLWFQFHRIIKEYAEAGEPIPYVLIENVSALRARGLDEVLGGLAALGYDAEWHCVPASALGAPHQRDRIWIVAYAECVGQPRQGQLVPSVHPAPGAFEEADRLVHAFRERALPFVCRGHDGVSGGMDRLKQLGNAVVPQVPELLGRAILERELLM
jgi:DNA (cytosine-5)-methyltransferase 1